jgi:hypothetical protein
MSSRPGVGTVDLEGLDGLARFGCRVRDDLSVVSWVVTLNFVVAGHCP